MKKGVLFLLLFVLFIAGNPLFAVEAKPESIDAVMDKIRQEQGLKKGESVKIEKISPVRLEELGDSVMEAMIGNTELHEQMDKRMGGEGSASLSAMHQRIGYHYLSGAPIGVKGMMGYPFLGTNRIQGGYMMGGYGYSPAMMGWFGWQGMFAGLVFLIVLIIAVILIVRAMNGQNRLFDHETPLDILKKRYAKGEITKDEYDKIKKDM